MAGEGQKYEELGAYTLGDGDKEHERPNMKQIPFEEQDQRKTDRNTVHIFTMSRDDDDEAIL